MNLFDLDEKEECLFCGADCTCPPLINDEAWQCELKPGSPVHLKLLRGRENVWCVIISNDKFNETCVVFDKNSGRHADIRWDNLIALGKYAK